MTEREGWLRLAHAFSKPRAERPEPEGSFNERVCFYNGLCFAVRWMPGLTYEARDSMSQAIHVELQRIAVRLGHPTEYLATYTDRGDKVRVAFCKRMAAQLERKPRKRSGRAEVRR